MSMLSRTIASVLLGLLVCPTCANPALADDAQPPLASVPLSRVKIDDPFWSPKLEVWRTITVNDCFEKFERDGALRNFDHVARGELNAPHGGPQWYDGLVYEMIRGAADLMAQSPDPVLKQRIDGYIDRIAAAAALDPDGYINTSTQMREPNHRWGLNGGNDREQHDLYNIGCLVEAGLHYYRATGETKLLATAVRAVNGMVKLMGPPPRKNIIPGHALGEESLVRLYELFSEQAHLKDKLNVPVDEQAYLDLARFWIDARGHHEGRQSFGDYGQDHKPALEQTTIEGHAVRATLFGAGVAAFGLAGNEPRYVAAADRLWHNMATRRLYITGGAGAIAHDEKFGGDFVLPNNGYLETCAAVAGAFFSCNLLAATGDAAKVDELERSLYNGALAGVSLNGNSYFYENPLIGDRNRVRWSWHPCPCCPPMFLKLMGALPGYIYSTSGDAVYVNLFIGSRANIELAGENQPQVTLTQSTEYPWKGEVRISLESEQPATFDIRVRVPAWCRDNATGEGLYVNEPAGRDAFVVEVNGERLPSPEIVHGYLSLRREWRTADKINLHMAMPVQRIKADRRVEANRGRIALMRGPIVYCLESLDNVDAAGIGRVNDLFLPDDAAIESEDRPDLLGGVTVVRARGKRLPVGDGGPVNANLVAIPYYANANRGPAEMLVWLPATPALATRPTLTSSATPTASHCFGSDTVVALNDGILPKNSSDGSIRRFTWWDHKGTSEWVQYEFPRPEQVSSVSVYWWDDHRQGRDCAPPKSWRLLSRQADGNWKPVKTRVEFGTSHDQFNVVEFDELETSALRIEAQLQPKLSAGILEWQVGEGIRKDE